MGGFWGFGFWGVWGRMGWGVFPGAIIHVVFETGSGFRFLCGMVQCGMFSNFLGSWVLGCSAGRWATPIYHAYK